MSISSDHLDAARHPWMQAEGLRRLLDAIKQGGGEARIVGGAVRDALLGRDVGDVDLAVNLPPEKVVEILTKAGLKVVPTGIDHGTITAVADRKGYEVTTLRHDVETDGRHAKVAFTDDWQADAARRDFTFNALYLDADGRLHDYCGGRADLENGHVRFIGKPQDRIREDVLRILRFFRFHAWFGKGDPDRDGLAACRELASLLPGLSAERVWREISKLLSADNPLPTWGLMKENGILQQVLPQAVDLQRLHSLLEVEKKYEVTPVAVRRLAALFPQDEAIARAAAQRLRLSSREAEKLAGLAVVPGRLKGHLDPVPFRRALYEHGLELTHDGLLLLGADDPSADLEPGLAEASLWQKPVFPIQGGDILKLGVAPGPQVGALLKAVENWWIGQDFRPDRAACLEKATEEKRRFS